MRSRHSFCKRDAFSIFRGIQQTLFDKFLLIFYHIGRGVSRAWNHKSPLEASANRHRSASTPGMMNSIICSPRFHTYTTGSHTHDHLWLLSACKFRRYILQDYTRAPESWRCSQRQICGCRHDRVFFLPIVDFQRVQLHRNLYRVNQDPQCKRAASFPP